MDGPEPPIRLFGTEAARDAVSGGETLNPQKGGNGPREDKGASSANAEAWATGSAKGPAL